MNSCKPNRHQIVAYSIAVGILVFLFISHRIIYMKSADLRFTVDKYEVLDATGSQGGSNTKYILLWTQFFDNKSWYLESEHLDYRYFESISCPETNCVITNNIELKPIHLFDAVMFHGLQSNTTPQYRSPHQVYVIGLLESPVVVKNKLEQDRNFYNLTSKYSTFRLYL